MAQLPSVFDAKGSEKMGNLEPVPAGWYVAEIKKSEMKDTSAGTGKYLALQLVITSPEEYEKRYVFTNLNLVNPSDIAVEIAQKELASICEACDIEELEDSTDLHGIPMAIRLSITPGSANWPPKNEIKSYKPESELPESDGDDPFAA